jgi:hypothetical protein
MVFGAPRVILDLGSDEAATVLVAGTGRSGTTWVGEIVAAMTRRRTIFEPFLLDTDYEFATLKGRTIDEGRVLRDYQLYIAANAGTTSPFYQPINDILRGRVKNEWCDFGAIPGIYRRRLIKAIRANLFLGYLAQTWPALKIVWVVRDIVDVVGSQVAMVRRGWKFDWDPNTVFSQEHLIHDWLGKYAPLMNSATTAVERLAHRWCIETIVPFRQGVHDRANVRLVRYKDLTEDAPGWEQISRFVSGNVWSGPMFAELLSRPSTTSRKADLIRSGGSNGDELSQQEISAIDRVAAAYGLDRSLVDWPVGRRFDDRPGTDERLQRPIR